MTPKYVIEDIQSSIENIFDEYPIEWVVEAWHKALDEAMSKADRMYQDVIVPSVDPDEGCEIWEGDNENQRTNRISTDL